jgi:hypothetical protein
MTQRIDPERDASTRRLNFLARAVETVSEELTRAGISDTSAAALMGIGRTELARKLARVSLARDDDDEQRKRRHIFLGEIAALPVESMVRIVNRLFLEPNGYAAVKLPEASKSRSNLELVSNMHRESSESTSAALIALSKGHIDRAHAADLIKEAREVIAVQLEAIAIAESAIREGVIGFPQVAS